MNHDQSTPADPIVANRDVVNDGNNTIGENEEKLDHDNKSSQPLPPSLYPHPKGDAILRETLAPNPTSALANPQGTRFNNKGQHRHWCLTFNNYTASDYEQIESALKTDESTRHHSQRSR